jgi:hypothetical protein
LYVFDPDPLTTAQVPYGPPYVDAEDSGLAVLNQQRVPRMMRVAALGDSFFLANKYVSIADFAYPFTKPTYNNKPLFDYSRADTAFEDVNAYYHITTIQLHVQNVGFDSLGNFPINVDAHAGTADQSSYIPLSKTFPELAYGMGGIDDAEDADVIVHEYTHFLSDCASPGNAVGNERLSIDEGLGDYMACSYSKSLSTYNWEKLFNWDGNFDNWHGRSCVTSKIYPTDLVQQRYKDADIWAGPLMEINAILGRDKTDRLVLATMFMLGKYITMKDAAQFFLKTDSILYGGADTWTIYDRFHAHGLLADTVVSIKEKPEENPVNYITKYFSSNNLLYVEFKKPQNGSIGLYDVQGRKILERDLSGDSKVTIETPQLTPGLYVLFIQTGDFNRTLKLVRQ